MRIYTLLAAALLASLTACGGSSSSDSPTPGASSSASSSSSSTAGAMLPQTGNPVLTELDTYKVFLSTAADEAARLAADKAKADIMLTWQTKEGGFYKHITDTKAGAGTLYSIPWTSGGKSSSWTGVNGEDLGTIDNDATTSELYFLSDLYKRSKDTKYRDAARRTLDFLLAMQYPTGGFPQVYPARGGTLVYSNFVTFNDDAMARVLLVLEQVSKKVAPLDSADLFTADQYTKLAKAIDKGVEYILKAQIVQNGTKTVWCAQHDPVTYAAREGRSYEWPSKSGSESVKVVAYLMSKPQTPEVKAAVQGALAWFRSVQVADTAYVNRPKSNTDDSYNPIQKQTGSVMWYRFYDLDKDVPFFSGRAATDNPPGLGKQYDIMKIEAERRYGYSWGGAYPSALLDYAKSVGY